MKSLAKRIADCAAILAATALLYLPTFSAGASAPVLENLGDLVIDTDVLIVDSTTNRVGIGTASPSVTLDVVGSAKFSTDYRANTWKNLDGNNAATLATGATPALTITNSLVVPSVNVSGLTASRALVTDGSKNLTSSSITATELAHLTGLTVDVQTGKQDTDADLTDLAGLSAAQGDLLYGNGTGDWAKLGKDSNATRYLSNTGTSNSPAWAQINVANGVTGTLPAANGGTGQSSYTTGDLLYASGSTALSKLADVGAGAYLRSGGTSTAPAWSTLILPNSATANRAPYATARNT